MKVLMMSEIEWGSENDRSSIADFRNMVDDLELRDLGYSGLWYTWERGRHPSSRIRERLARFLDSQRWNAAFALAVVEHLWRMKSYHTPIMVRLLGSSRKHKRRKRSFKFEQHGCSMTIVRGVLLKLGKVVKDSPLVKGLVRLPTN